MGQSQETKTQERYRKAVEYLRVFAKTPDRDAETAVLTALAISEGKGKPYDRNEKGARL